MTDNDGVVAAVRRDLARIAKRDPDLPTSALALSALTVAAAMDRPDSTTSLSMCAKTLLETLDRLWSLVPEEEAEDRLDELARRRASRRAAS